MNQSLNLAKHNLTILSNNKNYISDFLKKKYNKSINIVEIEDNFSKSIPDFTRFKAAHAKIDCFKYLASINSTKPVFLIDTDVLLVKDFPSWFNNDFLRSDYIYGYDITRHLASGYGKHVIDEDLKIFLKPFPIWYGEN